jgi:hypothetical protein
MEFRQWLEAQELEEGWKKWLGGAALAASTLGGIQAVDNHYSPSPSPSAVASQWDTSIVPRSSARRIAGDLRQLGPIDAMKIQMSGGASEHKLAAAKEYARNQFGVSDKDIHVVKVSDYLKKIWGNQWETALAQAKQHKTNMPGMPDLNRLDDPIVLVKKSQRKEQGAWGTCRQWGAGATKIAICTVDPTEWGNNETSREELTHSTQDNVQGQIAGMDDYAAKTHEFGAKLAELKRSYYTDTGKIAKDGYKIFDWAIKNYEKLPKNVQPIIVLYVRADEEQKEKIIRAADEMLPGLVQQGDNPTRNMA